MAGPPMGDAGMPARGGQVRFGPAGWSYPDWEGIVYPADRPRGFHEAEYLAGYFDTIEINSSFYAPPRAENARRWASYVAHNPNFAFTAKLWRGFTHERSATAADEAAFKAGVAPLAEAGRLGALLAQFPWSFKQTADNREYFAGLQQRFQEYPLVLEVRHASWNRPEIRQWLGELGVGLCNIDQPIIGRSLAPSQAATSPIGYVRLHGRNYQQWFSENASTAERYDYLYTQQELEPWADRIRHIATKSSAVFVIANNHARGQAPANALQLEALVTGAAVAAPPGLAAAYPDLARLAQHA